MGIGTLYQRLILIVGLLVTAAACGPAGRDRGTAAGSAAAEPPVTAMPSAGTGLTGSASPTSPLFPTTLPLPPEISLQQSKNSEIACMLAYADAGNLFCFTAGGAPRLLAARAGLADPKLASDGRWVAFRVEAPGRPPELWVVGVAAEHADPRRLVVAGDIANPDSGLINAPASFAWLPGTHTLLFDTRFAAAGAAGGLALSPAHAPSENDRNYDLWSVSADTGALAAVLPAGQGGDFAPAPDGCNVALAHPDGVGLVRADGSRYAPDLVTFNSILTYGAPAFAPRPVWSPDGRFFSVLVPSADPLAENAAATLYRVDVAGRVAALRTLPGNFVSGGALRPAVAPDGRQVAYSLRQAGPVPLETITLAAAEPAASGLGIVDQRADPSGWGWSPDSSRYLYTATPRSGPRGLFVAEAGGSAVQGFLPMLTSLLAAQWIDSATVAFIGGFNGGGWNLYQQALGSEPQLLATGLTGAATLAVRAPASPDPACAGDSGL